MSILKKAQEIFDIPNEHRKYGSIEDSTNDTAKIASLMLKQEITAEIVVAVYIAGKLNRESYSHKADNLIDAVGYLEMWNQIKTKLENDKIQKG